MTETSKPSNTLRLLILAPTIQGGSGRFTPISTTFPAFLTRLTGRKAPEDITSFSGYTTHSPLHLKTRYYEANVNIWCDELPWADSGVVAVPAFSSESEDPSDMLSNTGNHHVEGPDEEHKDAASTTTATTATTLNEWQEQMTSSPAREVREVIGGILLLLPYNSRAAESVSSSRSSQWQQGIISQIQTWVPFVEAISTLRDMIEDETGRDVAGLVVLQDANSWKAGGNREGRSQTLKVRSATTGDVGEALIEKLEDECLSTHGLLGWDYVHLRAEQEEQDRSEGNNSSGRGQLEGATMSSENSQGTAINPTSRPSAGQGQEIENNDRNEFGEKVGFPRVIEVLSGVNWSAGASSTTNDFDEDDDDDDDDDESFDMSFLDDIDLPSLRSGITQTGRDDRKGKGEKQIVGSTSSPTTNDNDDNNEYKRDPKISKPMKKSEEEMQREFIEFKMAMLGIEKWNEDNDDDDGKEIVDDERDEFERLINTNTDTIGTDTGTGTGIDTGTDTGTAFIRGRTESQDQKAKHDEVDFDFNINNKTRDKQDDHDDGHDDVWAILDKKTPADGNTNKVVLGDSLDVDSTHAVPGMASHHVSVQGFDPDLEFGNDVNSDSDVQQNTSANKQDQAIKVDNLQGLMDKVLAVREVASEMKDGPERQRFARKEIRRLMKDL